MAEPQSTSLTLPQNRPDEEPSRSSKAILEQTGASGSDPVHQASRGIPNRPTANGETTDPTPAAGSSVNEQVSHALKEDNGRKTHDAQEDTPSPSGKLGSSIHVDKTSKHQFSHPVEIKSKQLINQARKAIENDSKGTAIEGSIDGVHIGNLTRVVAQLSHLMSVEGVGRDTQARAIAYLDGPDRVDVKTALRLAKVDRSSKANGRRASKASYRGGRSSSSTSNTNAVGESNLASNETAKPASASIPISQATTAKVNKAKEVIISDTDKTAGGLGSTRANGELNTGKNRAQSYARRAWIARREKSISEDAPLSSKIKTAKESFRRPWNWKNKPFKGGKKDAAKENAVENAPKANATNGHKPVSNETSEDKSDGGAALYAPKVSPTNGHKLGCDESSEDKSDGGAALQRLQTGPIAEAPA